MDLIKEKKKMRKQNDPQNLIRPQIVFQSGKIKKWSNRLVSKWAMMRNSEIREERERAVKKARERALKQGIAQGLERGKDQGSMLKTVKVTLKSVKRGMRAAEIADMLEEEETSIQTILKIKEEHPDYTEEQIAMKMIHDSGCPISRYSADSFKERICS